MNHLKSNIPDRYALLVILRQLAKGHQLSVFGEFGWEHHLEGAHYVCTFKRYLIKHELVKQVAPFFPFAIEAYEINEKGLALLKEGELWWKKTSLLRKILIMLWG